MTWTELAASPDADACEVSRRESATERCSVFLSVFFSDFFFVFVFVFVFFVVLSSPSSLRLRQQSRLLLCAAYRHFLGPLRAAFSTEIASHPTLLVQTVCARRHGGALHTRASRQTILIAETIRGMKLAMRRRDNDSDSDDSIAQPTNRGNKLKRKAANVREGRLDTTGGRSYKKEIEHAGYRRYILQPNPPRFDQDGDLIDEEDDQDDDYASPAEDNPWSETRLEDLLAPLTSAAELPEHPSLSIPFTARALTEMCENAREAVFRERKTLWDIKQLLLRLRGDDPWIPVGKVETEQDILLLDQNASITDLQSIANDTEASVNEAAMSLDHQQNNVPDPVVSTINGPTKDVEGTAPDAARSGDTNGIQSIDMAAQNAPEGSADGASHLESANGALKTSPTAGVPSQNGPHDANPAPVLPLVDNDVDMDRPAGQDEAVRASIEPASPSASTSGQTQHRMTTRARARTPSSPDQDASQISSPAPSSIPSIHGFFGVPAFSLPDSDFGLPASEAEDTRRMLLLFVQKQEQVVREAEEIMQGLLKADRMRKEVYRWCKAEGHVGEMSDGEDWYDREEWNLDADLIKGKEEEEVEEEGRAKGRRRRGAQH
ncbi:hypothetical protein MBLNU459_g1376t1 [Dothideomycetes sp. NU459]